MISEMREPVGEWIVQGSVSLLPFCAGTIYIQARPPHCNRGDWLMYQETIHHLGQFHVSAADHWPRYVFGSLTVAKQQAEEWLRRHGVDPQTGELYEMLHVQERKQDG